jgi:hypothetical protein
MSRVCHVSCHVGGAAMSDRVAVESEGIGAEMKRGSALIYVGRTYHGKDKRPLLRDEFA